MAWQSVSFLTDASHAEPVCDALLDVGALSASIEDADAGTPDEQPQFGEPGSIVSSGWNRSRVMALLEADADVGALLARASVMAGLPAVPAWTVEEVAEQNWVRLTQSQFDPIRVSERLWIVPSWHAAPDPAAVNLVLDPGMAFGTGSHPTTRLCLEWLERNVQSGCSVLDYGCGSGVLAVVLTNPYAGRYEPDIVPMMEAMKPLGVELAQRLLAAMKIEAAAIAAAFGLAGTAQGGLVDHRHCLFLQKKSKLCNIGDGEPSTIGRSLHKESYGKDQCA